MITIDTYKTDAELVASWLKEIAERNNRGYGQKDSNERLKKGEYDLQMSFKGMNNADPWSDVDAYLSSVGYMNVDYGTMYKNPEADKLVEAMHKATTMEC